ncbi:MAG: threonylcarbamoyl-AMP synthase [Legionellaceae bacterium]|nr:threonylcarbamoyl-AMP synthase [Legionellaceae bacterium]
MCVIINEIERAADMLLSGKVVAIPTETVYGLAANALDDAAIAQVYTLKNRPRSHPLIMHVAPEWDLRQWVTDIPDYALQLMQHFWPGPLTLVLPYRPLSTGSLVTGGQNSIAIRAPAHPTSLALLRRLQVPLVAPSANPFGKISPTCAEHVQQSFSETDFYILDGGRCEVGIESTIVSALNANGGTILRPGSITATMLGAHCQLPELTVPHTVRVPGQLPRHYEPNKPLFYVTSQRELTAFVQQSLPSVFVLHQHKPESVDPSLFLPFPAESAQAAWALYDSLRIADASEADCIALVLPQASDDAQGVRERIMKAGKPWPHSPTQ